MTSSSENSTKREKVVGFTLTSTEKGGGGVGINFIWVGSWKRGGTPIFWGGGFKPRVKL